MVGTRVESTFIAKSLLIDHRAPVIFLNSKKHKEKSSLLVNEVARFSG